MTAPIWIAGMPRSGTSWVAQIFGAHPNVLLKYDPLFSYAFKDAVDETSSPENWRRFFDRVGRTADPYMDQERPKAEGLAPVFKRRSDAPRQLVMKTNRRHHLLAGALKAGAPFRLLLIVRDPIETIGSWLANPTEFPQNADPDAEWRNGACRKTGPGEYWGFDDWKRVTSLYLELADREDVFLLEYSAIDANPAIVVEDVFSWAGLAPDDQVADFLRASRERHDEHPRSVFRDPARRGDPDARLPAGAAAEIRAELAGAPLGRFLNRPGVAA